jgi:hypothetical protein
MKHFIPNLKLHNQSECHVYKKKLEKAERRPHAITYHPYEIMESPTFELNERLEESK